ncbi:Radical SAM domain protein [Denitrovibrio acetiphilus DSM 12809]|uniref:Radical SAM domain protein n=1 Tax=Denitrovibrio acetiphilus (strain DSM 12809 / NBRC 114555 / N2460) TaxID=522772 RepID=D4H7G9_DENA2|nr:AmmeMemoRadiSam system radical SAM enzyme [Denitrovibrio acetiphilus]ADD67968.1 Radical SAM domain protein [Denitrovibrio acetiphilus DSM 12809]
MGVLARHWEQSGGGDVTCRLCPHMCRISKGETGICLIRRNIDGMLQQTAYGEPCSVSVDPVEKKPLYHFHPGKDILSVGTNGCNMRCRHCQNWQISTKETTRQSTTPERLLRLSKANNSFGIAYTYNEPIVWYEFIYDCAKIFREAGQANVMVTNGQINNAPLKELLPFIDAMNIDIKGFTEKFYKDEGGYLRTTLDTIETSAKAGTHIELTNLLIPGLNDNIETFKKMCIFIADIDKNIPLHISRYFPQHKSSLSITNESTLKDFRKLAMQYLNYVYVGNASIPGTSDTKCPQCGEIIIKRNGYYTQCLTEDNKCTKCSTSLSIHF